MPKLKLKQSPSIVRLKVFKGQEGHHLQTDGQTQSQNEPNSMTKEDRVKQQAIITRSKDKQYI